MEAVGGHIRQYFGVFEHVFHELASPDIHVDICVVTPSALCCWWPPAIIWGAGAVYRGEEPGSWEASSGRPSRIGRGAGVVPVPWGYLVTASGGRLLLSGPSAHRQPGDDRHGGRTEEGTGEAEPAGVAGRRGYHSHLGRHRGLPGGRRHRPRGVVQQGGHPGAHPA